MGELASTSPLARPGAKGGLGAPPGGGAAALGLAASAPEEDLQDEAELKEVTAAAGPLPVVMSAGNLLVGDTFGISLQDRAKVEYVVGKSALAWIYKYDFQKVTEVKLQLLP